VGHLRPGLWLAAMDDGTSNTIAIIVEREVATWKTTALHGAARHGCEDRERGRQIPTSAESAWECRCKRRRKVRRLIGRRLPYRPMSSRLLSSVDRPTSWPCSSLENTNWRQDKGIEPLPRNLAISRFARN